MNEFLRVLACDGPNSTLPTRQHVFQPLIGSWDLDVTWFDKGQPVRSARGEWHFSWVLEGRAVQDVWIVPSRIDRASGAEPYEYGTSVRFFDTDLEAWRSIWMGPVRGLLLSFVVQKDGEDIILETRKEDGQRMRWMFSEITTDRFHWCSRVEVGDRWETLQTFVGTRRA